MLFLDSSDPKEVERLWQWGVLSGITTNPLIISREAPGRSLEGVIGDILKVSKGPLSVELTNVEPMQMVREAQDYFKWDQERIIIKVPVTADGIEVIKDLRGLGIPTNATCIMSSQQAYLAALAGARYVSLFWGRIGDMGHDAGLEVGTTRTLLDREGLPSRIIAGSIRTVADVEHALVAGAHIVTVPPAILRKMVHHPRTEETIREFNDAWARHCACKP
jgi:transaldolase